MRRNLAQPHTKPCGIRASVAVLCRATIFFFIVTLIPSLLILNRIQRNKLRFPALHTWTTADQDRISDFKLKLMDIDSEHLGIPKTQYYCTIQVMNGLTSSLLSLLACAEAVLDDRV